MNAKIAVIGLGYVGLPLARLFATKYNTVGCDINEGRVNELKNGIDSTLEVDDKDLQQVLKSELNDEIGLFVTTSVEDIKDCNYFIVTVPTPIDQNKNPDLTPLKKASETVGSIIKKGDIVIYESTVYPGATEEEVVPIIEEVSGLKFNEDFFAGYSPERINPGDKEHTVDKILKVTSGSTEEVGKKVDELYASVIIAGTHLAPSIKVAEAAKVIENAQRDINIAFVNELAKIFNILEIDTHAVLEAAGTKWNFLPFKPGLVGGHCIGVDPYYIAQKAQEVGYHPEIILAGRRLNDSMGQYVASEVVKGMIKKGIDVTKAKVLLLGVTFKENCQDIRNTRAMDVYHGLVDYGVKVGIYDPWAKPKEVKDEYGVSSCNTLDVLHKDVEDCDRVYDAIVLTVAHKEFLDLDLKQYGKPTHFIYDVKGVLPLGVADARL